MEGPVRLEETVAELARDREETRTELKEATQIRN